MIARNPLVESVPEQLTAPSQRETLQHLQEETEYFYCHNAQPISHKGLMLELIVTSLASGMHLFQHYVVLLGLP